MNTKKIKLSDKDVKTITLNSNICTDSHGKNCETDIAAESDKEN